MSLSPIAWLYLIPLIVALVVYYRRHSKREIHYRTRLAETVKSGVTEPLTLHPVIDTDLPPAIRPPVEFSHAER